MAVKQIYPDDIPVVQTSIRKPAYFSGRSFLDCCCRSLQCELWSNQIPLQDTTHV